MEVGVRVGVGVGVGVGETVGSGSPPPPPPPPPDALGVTELDAADAEPVPEPFVAFTVKVYAVPFVSPVTVHDNGVAGQDVVMAPGLEVIV